MLTRDLDSSLASLAQNLTIEKSGDKKCSPVGSTPSPLVRYCYSVVRLASRSIGEAPDCSIRVWLVRCRLVLGWAPR